MEQQLHSSKLDLVKLQQTIQALQIAHKNAESQLSTANAKLQATQSNYSSEESDDYVSDGSESDEDSIIQIKE